MSVLSSLQLTSPRSGTSQCNHGLGGAALLSLPEVSGNSNDHLHSHGSRLQWVGAQRPCQSHYYQEYLEEGRGSWKHSTTGAYGQRHSRYTLQNMPCTKLFAIRCLDSQVARFECCPVSLNSNHMRTSQTIYLWVVIYWEEWVTQPMEIC